MRMCCDENDYTQSTCKGFQVCTCNVVPINIWKLTQRCKEHVINFQKRADKVMREMSKREKKNKIFPKHFT